MRMGWGIFWGIVVILIGLSILINVIFHVNIPLLKILLGLFFIYLGIKIIFGIPACGFGWKTDKDAVFHESDFSGIPPAGEYNAIFGKAVIDLTRTPLTEPVTRLKIAAVFGSAEVRLNREVPVKILANTAFGNVRLPDRSSGGFGTVSWTSDHFQEQEKHLALQADAVFGSIHILYP